MGCFTGTESFITPKTRDKLFWIPNWLFFLLSLLFFGLSFQYLSRISILHRFQNPDTALAWIALLFAFVILFQQITNLRFGIVYMFMGGKSRLDIESHPNKQPLVSNTWVGRGMKGAYWLLLVVMLLLASQLTYGTYQETDNNKQLIEVIQKSNSEIISAVKDSIQNSNQELIKRIDDVQKQNAEILRRLEAQYESDNNTSTTK